MSNLNDATLIRLPQYLVAKIEAIGAGHNVEHFVEQAVQTYVQSLQHHYLTVQLAQQYNELAASYAEIADELADDLWLSSENEALDRTEHKAAK